MGLYPSRKRGCPRRNLCNVYLLYLCNVYLYLCNGYLYLCNVYL